MNNLTAEDAQRLQGAVMTDRNSAKIGKIVDVYLDNDTEQPEWALVHTGMFGGRETFVPLAESALTHGELQVPYSKAKVKDAPNAEPDGELSRDEEARLYAHYGLDYSDGSFDSGPTTDNAMTRSEERLNVGVVKRPSQTVRLRKSITSEQVVVDREVVPVERVRSDKDTATEQAQINEELQKEQIDVDDETGVGRST